MCVQEVYTHIIRQAPLDSGVTVQCSVTIKHWYSNVTIEHSHLNFITEIGICIRIKLCIRTEMQWYAFVKNLHRPTEMTQLSLRSATEILLVEAC